jgi:hypothetical protein
MEEGISIKKQTNRIEGTVREGKERELKIGNLKEETYADMRKNMKRETKSQGKKDEGRKERQEKRVMVREEHKERKEEGKNDRSRN